MNINPVMPFPFLTLLFLFRAIQSKIKMKHYVFDEIS